MRAHMQMRMRRTNCIINYLLIYLTNGHLKNRTSQMHFQMHFQRRFKEKLLTAGVKKIHTPTNLFQNISYRNKIMQIIPPPPPHTHPNSHFLYDTSTRQRNMHPKWGHSLVLINFACKLRIRFAAPFEKQL